MESLHRNNASHEIGREDTRFKCRMCGKPIFGVVDSDKNYDTVFYCSQDCNLAGWFYCFVCLSMNSFIPSGWILAYLISGSVHMSMLLGVVGFLVVLLVLNSLLVYQTISSWDRRQRIIKNKMLESQGERIDN